MGRWMLGGFTAFLIMWNQWPMLIALMLGAMSLDVMRFALRGGE